MASTLKKIRAKTGRFSGSRIEEVQLRQVIDTSSSNQLSSLHLSFEQAETVRRAAAVARQSLEEFTVSAVLQAAAAVLAPPATHPLDKVFGIFKDEPLMEDLMNRIRQDRQAEIEIFEKQAQEEAQLQEVQSG